MTALDPDATERFERCYALARDPLARYLARRAAPDAVEDLFAEVMTVAWRRIGDIPDGTELPWLYGVARRVLANHRRASGRLGACSSGSRSSSAASIPARLRPPPVIQS